MSNSLFKALADPTRRQILGMLNRRPEMSAGEIAEAFDISAPSMSHHFNVLKEADLVSTRRQGQQILYSLNTTVVEDLIGLLYEMFGKDNHPARRPR
ncbi:MAG: autorepressor SdpR family transcription factor [Acidobacteria bacterium]|jgi:DNA-binding transcriptional ArsR family regulator|nr:autorepressor SdpR family transcription factor [Acidobacteriota bacterium]